MPNLSFRRLAALSFIAIGALGAVIAVLGSNNQPATAATATPPVSPSFSGLADSGADRLTGTARDALAQAGAPRDAATTVSVRGDFTVAVVRGKTTYLALVNNASQRATVVNTSPEDIVKRAGTWVAAGGSSTGGATTLAMLVPDGIDSVEVTDTDGAKSRADVVDNITLIQRDDLSATEYEFGGKTHRAELTPRSAP